MAKTNAERQNLFRKKVAKRLHAANKVLDAQAKLSQAYEELALAHGYKDWNTAAVGVAANGQQIIADIFFDIKAARPLPTYSVPGLIDHF